MCPINTDKVVCGYDISDPRVEVRICAWSIMKMLQHLIAEDINPDNTDLVLGEMATWNAILEKAKFLDAVVYEARRIIDPDSRRFNNMLADEVYSQLSWAQTNPVRKPLLTRSATGRWKWDPSARDISYLFHVAINSKFVPLGDTPQTSDQPKGARDRSEASLRRDGDAATAHSPLAISKSGRVSPPAEDHIGGMADALHRGADLDAAAEGGDAGADADFDECLAEIEQHRQVVRATIRGWKRP